MIYDLIVMFYDLTVMRFALLNNVSTMWANVFTLNLLLHQFNRVNSHFFQVPYIMGEWFGK